MSEVASHQPHDCLPSRLFRRRSKKTSKLRVTGLCAGNSPVTGEFPAQRASNAENVSIWWRHHAGSLAIGRDVIGYIHRMNRSSSTRNGSNNLCQFSVLKRQKYKYFPEINLAWLWLTRTGNHCEYRLRQWETMLHCNGVSNWLSLYPWWFLANASHLDWSITMIFSSLFVNDSYQIAI